MTTDDTTRGRILAAAGRVMKEQGLAHTTTKEIARVAGYSEAALYKHFQGKEELFLEVMRIRLAPIIDQVARLPEHAGSKTVRSQLESLAHLMLAVYIDSGQLAMALFAEPALLVRQRAAFRASGGGPQQANAVLAEYLRKEQGLGRVATAAHPIAVADQLLGACFQRAFFVAFMGADVLDRTDDRFVKDLVKSVLLGIRP